MASRQIEFAIVGGGVAGCLMYYLLSSAGKKVILFNDSANSGSSHIAAGLINPITGRKFVKSWNIGVLLEAANRSYQRIEREYSIKFRHDVQVIRVLNTPEMINEWSAREIDKLYAEYIVKSGAKLPDSIQSKAISYGLIDQGMRIDFKPIMDLARQLAEKDGLFYDQKFDADEVVHHGTHMTYQDMQFNHVIFCEGSEVRNNPLWNWLPLVPAKGERLIIHAPDLQLPHVYNDGKIIIPLDDDHYWVGSNYEWKTLDTVPTEKVKEDLIAFLDKTLKVRYDIVDHAAQVRPSSYNRRPFVGRHPDHPNYYILNGLGTKGASLAPYCAEQMIGYILEGADLDEEIDVSRVHLRQDYGG